MAIRNILITGGTTGIGFELVKRLAPRHNIMLVGRTPSEELVELLERASHITFVKADFSQPEKAASTIAKALKKEKWTGIDNAILNAGTGFVTQPHDETPDSIRKTLDVNLNANIAICGQVYDLLAAVKGKVTFIGSVAHKGKADFASYAASKAGLHGFARALREEWRGKIGVQILHLGPTRTDMHEKAGLKLGNISMIFTRPKDMAAMIEKSISSPRFSTKLSFFQDWTGATMLKRGLR